MFLICLLKNTAIFNETKIYQNNLFKIKNKNIN